MYELVFFFLRVILVAFAIRSHQSREQVEFEDLPMKQGNRHAQLLINAQCTVSKIAEFYNFLFARFLELLCCSGGNKSHYFACDNLPVVVAMDDGNQADPAELRILEFVRQTCK